MTEKDRENFDGLALDALDDACTLASVCLEGRPSAEIKNDVTEWWDNVGADLLLGPRDMNEDEVDGIKQSRMV